MGTSPGICSAVQFQLCGSKEVILLKVGEEYTRNQIREYLGGGSTVSYLPTIHSIVVAACLSKKMNPRAPEEVLCGRGERMARDGEQLARQSGSIPVFLKHGANRWEYRGSFEVVGSLTSGARFVQAVSASGRGSDVSRVVLLRRVSD
jgi:hypothetical protein